MKYVFAILLASLVTTTSHAATLLCGAVACDEAAAEKVSWPETDSSSGTPLRVEPNLMVMLPGPIGALRQYRQLLDVVYEDEAEPERVVSAFSVTIREGMKGGLVGGWDTLFRAKKGTLVAYYFKDPTETQHYIAIIRNRGSEARDPLGRIKYLQLSSTGFSREAFLELLGSVTARDIDRP